MTKHFLLSDIDHRFIGSPSQLTKDYYVNSDGTITTVHKNTGKKKTSKGSLNNGYHGIWVYDCFGRRTILYVHTIVGKVLCTKPFGYDTSYKTIHLDKNPTNNQLSNLMVVDEEEWKEHYMEEFSKMKGRDRSNNPPSSKLTIEQVRSIKLLFKQRYSVKSVAKLYDEVSITQLYRIRNGDNWANVQ